MIEARRDEAIDIVKFVAIVMVICSHVISYRPGFDLHVMPSYVMNFIMVVNMPLFYMLSGYFSRRLHDSGSWSRLGCRIARWFWSIGVFAFVFACLESLIGKKYPVMAIPLWTIKKFFYNWFFFTLALCDVTTFISLKYKRYSVWWMFGVFSFFLVLSGKVWYSRSLVAMIPFYWFGLFALPTIRSRKRIFCMVAMLGVGLMMVATFFVGNIASNGLSFYWDSLDVYHPQFRKVINLLARFIIGACGSVSIIWLIGLCVAAVPRLSILSVLGAETFGIYLLQGGIIKWLSNPVVGLDAGFPMILFSSGVVFVLSFCLVKMLKWNKCVRFAMGFGR